MTVGTDGPKRGLPAAQELLPCPFCGGKAKTYGPYGWYRQWCITHNCPTFYNGGSEAFQNYPTEAYAIAAWNTRADVQVAQRAGSEAAVAPTLAGGVAPDSSPSLVAENRRLREALTKIAGVNLKVVQDFQSIANGMAHVARKALGDTPP